MYVCTSPLSSEPLFGSTIHLQRSTIPHSTNAVLNAISHKGRRVLFMPCWCGECGAWQHLYMDEVLETIEIFPELDT